MSTNDINQDLSDNSYTMLDDFEKENKITRNETLKFIREGILSSKEIKGRIYVAWKNAKIHDEYLRKGKEALLEQVARSESDQQYKARISQDSNISLEHDKDEEISSIPFITAEAFAAAKITKTLGTVRGSTVRARHIGKDVLASIKNIIGGEVKEYTELLADGREEAIYRMQSDAVRLGANAVISVRFTSSTIGAGIAEILAYGTAVIIERV